MKKKKKKRKKKVVRKAQVVRGSRERRKKKEEGEREGRGREGRREGKTGKIGDENRRVGKKIIDSLNPWFLYAAFLFLKKTVKGKGRDDWMDFLCAWLSECHGGEDFNPEVRKESMRRWW